MCVSRKAHIRRICLPHAWVISQGYANGSKLYNDKGVTVQPTDQYKVYMTNGVTLKFHEMFLELVDEEG